ncbi:MAG: DMT family transporter [Fusobacterium sp.]|uniref:DMT family transporter n=1 Tax=Fusobacterium sp. TaxID=68766 RepID=UPI0029439860|nr:DMT family transporter [Fusobacterium sp.]MDY3059190.1 DMT family transporter [Fusobacterium sp.]MEE1476690.1 DMT family transporter [Fusobacterium sp.]
MLRSKLMNLSAMLIFGTIAIFVRNIELTSKEIAVLRGVIGSIFLLGVMLFSKEKTSFSAIKKNLPILVLSGLGVGANWIFLFEAYKYTTVSIATLSYYCAPIFVTIMAPIILKEKISLIKFLCVCTAMVGMLCIVGTNKGSIGEGYNHFLGIIYGLTAAVGYASVILMNKFIKGLKGVETTVTQLVFASILLLPYVMITSGFDFSKMTGISWGYMIFLGIVHTGFAYALYFSSLKELKGQTIAVLSYIDPITAILISALFLGEQLTMFQIIGGVLILGSTFISETQGKKE